MRAPIREWLIERYGDVEEANWWADHGDAPVVLDAGCGAGLAAVELFGTRLRSIRYIGMDVSRAVDIAAQRFAERELPGGFLQADLAQPPFVDGSLDVVFSEEVLHHTDSTERALKRLVRLLRPGGRFLFYVYRRKGPIREFTDDYVRDRLQGMEPDEAWAQLMPVTKLGKALGDLHVDVEWLARPAPRHPGACTHGIDIHVTLRPARIRRPTTERRPRSRGSSNIGHRYAPRNAHRSRPTSKYGPW